MAVGKLLDYSQARPPLAKVKAAGYSGVYRYVCSDKAEQGLPGKRLSAAERDQILAAGLDIGLHCEEWASLAQGGYATGLEYGKIWADYAHNVLGAPKGMTLVVAIDYDTGGIYPQTVADHLHGVHDAFQGEYQVGVYGSIYVVDAALAEKAAVHGVQTNAWSNGKVSSWAHVYQHGPTEFPGTDYNDILRTPHGMWLQTLNGDDTMSAADVQALKDYIGQALQTLTKGDVDKDGNPLPGSTNTHPVNLTFADQRQRRIEAAVNTLSVTAAANQTQLLEALKNADGQVDVPTLSANLAVALGPDLAKALADDLAARLTS